MYIYIVSIVCIHYTIFLYQQPNTDIFSFCIIEYFPWGGKYIRGIKDRRGGPREGGGVINLKFVIQRSKTLYKMMLLTCKLLV